MSENKTYQFYKIKEVLVHLPTYELYPRLIQYIERYRYKTFAGLSAGLRAREWTYYDVIKWSYEF